jgi:hypothetical protein
MIVLDGVPVANPRKYSRFVVYTKGEDDTERQVWMVEVTRTNTTNSTVTVSLQEVNSQFEPKKRTQPKQAIFTNSFPLEEGETLHYCANIPGGKVILGTITKVSPAPPLTAPGL